MEAGISSIKKLTIMEFKELYHTFLNNNDTKFKVTQKDGSSFIGTIHTWFESDDENDSNGQPHQNVWFVIQEVLIPSTTDSDFKPGSSQILSELDFPIDIEICH